MRADTRTELWRRSATDLAEAIRTRQVSCREVVQSHLDRIDAVNGAINAVTVVLAEQAVDAAEAADRDTAAGRQLPRLHGVPFTIKGNIDLVGTPTTQGARALQDAYPTRDAPVVERLKSAGAIPIGRTNLPTYAMRWHTDSELWGPTVNPWDRRRTPGASSGGEAAALATGMTPLGVGNDTLGSLRWPAQCCGVAALKPTLGRIPDASTAGPEDLPIGVQLADVQGPMARHITDLRAALEVLAGPTWRDPWSVPAPLRGPPLAVPVRVALVIDPGGHGTAPQVQAGVRAAADALAEGGYVIDEIEPPAIAAAARTLLDMLTPPSARSDELAAVFPSMPDKTRRFLTQLYEVTGEPDPTKGMLSFIVRRSLLRTWGEFQQTHPLIVGPIYTDVPFEAGTDLDPGRVAETIQGMRLALAVSALGLPAVAVPVGLAQGLPQAVQVIGPRYREDLCLDAAETIERRLGVITPIDPR